MPGHPLALEDAARRLPLSDGSHVAVVLVAGGGVARRALHVVALHHPGKAKAAGGACDVDPVALLEQGDGDLGADRGVAEILLLDAELLDQPMRLLALLLELAEVRLRLPALGLLFVELVEAEL